MIRRVYVASRCSPGDGRTMAQNLARAERLCLAAVKAGVAPLAPHLLLTRFLDDSIPEERIQGMRAGAAWLFVANAIWVDGAHGISIGMRAEVEKARELGIPVVMDPECWQGIA